MNGTYEFVGNVIRAFHAPGVTHEHIARLRQAAQGVQTGAITRQDATLQLEGIADPLIRLWNRANENAGALSVLVAVIALFLQIYYQQGSDEQAIEQHRDAQQQIQIQQKIYEELRKRSETVQARVTPKETTRSRPRAAPAQKQATETRLNRHERRKAAARTRRLSRNGNG